MLLPHSELGEVWERVKESAAENPDAITVLLIVALDVDAVATCAMLTRLLENDEIPHNVKPVLDYGMLAEIYVENIVDKHDLRNIVLINCGGVIDLVSHLQDRLDLLDSDSGASPRQMANVPHADCRWLIIDSHRPHNLQNATRSSDLLCILSDGEHEERAEQLQDLVAQEYILDDPEFQSDPEDDFDEPPQQRRRLNEDEYRQMSPDSRSAEHVRLKLLERIYYSASWYGTSSAVLVYELVQRLNKTSNEYLWLAVIGLTDQLVHEKMLFEKYVSKAQELHSEVAALNQIVEGEMTEVHDSASGVSISHRQHVSSAMRLENSNELRLCLLRHWSLYDALQHSTYIASRMGLYHTTGRDKLDVWLARMGIPLDECRQEYAYMKKEFRDGLFEQMMTYGHEFGLLQLTYPSFRRVTNYTSTVTASDLVYCVAAQLESSGRSTSSGSSDEDEEAAIAEAFNLALSSLTEHGAKDASQNQGLERAKRLQRALIEQGNRIINEKQYFSMGDFYKVILKPNADAEQFTRVQALTKLALFVADALREATLHRDGDAKPLLMAAPKKDLKKDQQTYLVVTVLGSSRYWKGSGENSFGDAFRKTALDPTYQARVKHEDFESSVCEVAKDDLEAFMEGVTLNFDG
mmetsp:Transcript_76187/g.126945  ORF Transcript_76187/g.126945 Transcript_76187/m.126945 type:complete len:636 (-) Transcript_76187:230-2137(-)